MTPGGRNLAILGGVAILIALATTSVSLAIYHDSGDIYLDRSRPGFLPDEAEIEADGPDTEYVFDKTGKLDKATIEEYVKQLTAELESLEKYEEPFDEATLSDKKLGL